MGFTAESLQTDSRASARKTLCRCLRRSPLAQARFRKNYVILELCVGKGKVSDTDFNYWQKGESSWGYAHVHPSKGIPDKLIKWIEIARSASSTMVEEGDDEDGLT